MRGRHPNRRIRAVVTGSLLAAAVFVTAATPSADPRGTRAVQPAPPLVLAGISVVDVRRGGIIPNVDLFIVDGTIASIAPHGTVPVPAASHVSDESGRYVIPGLIDMHAHLSDVDDAPRMLSYGITSARHMAQVGWWTRTLLRFPDGRVLRDRIRRGELEGPDLLVASLTLDGKPPISPLNRVVETPVAAREAVRKAARDKFDFVKVYDRLDADVFDAILDEAKQRGVPVAGHVPVAVGIDRALSSSLTTIEHLTGYVDQHHVKFLIDERRLAEYAQRTEASGKVNCPTLVIWRNIPPKDSLRRLRAQPEYQHLSWRVRWLWKTTLKYLAKKPYQGDDLSGDMSRLTVAMTRALYEAGAPIVAGTDMNFLGVYPGISLHQELVYLHDAGLSPLDALRAATINAAMALGQDETIGSVEARKRANLVVLDENPLRDVRATRAIHAVIKDGRRVRTTLPPRGALTPAQ